MKTAYEHTKGLIQKVTPTMSYKDGDFKAWQKDARRSWLSLLA